MLHGAFWEHVYVNPIRIKAPTFGLYTWRYNFKVKYDMPSMYAVGLHGDPVNKESGAFTESFELVGI